MFQIFPFLPWLATVTSAVVLIGLWATGELSGSGAALLLGWFLIAGYCQFFGASAFVTTSGLVLQTILAICLIIRWKASV